MSGGTDHGQLDRKHGEAVPKCRNLHSLDQPALVQQDDLVHLKFRRLEIGEIDVDLEPLHDGRSLRADRH